MTLVIALEYFLFKKLGPGIEKYSSLVDIMLLLFFIGDWVTVIIAYTNRLQSTPLPSFKISSLFGFTTFSWRTLFVTLIVQKWQLKILAPVIGTLVAAGYAIYYTPNDAVFLSLNVGTQLFNIILIVFCEDRVKWKLMWTNLQQEKWMQVNNFILNSIPENIMILGLSGEAKFVSESCKSFMKKCRLAIETKDYLKRIRDLQQQDDCDAESPTKIISFFEKKQQTSFKFDILEDLIENLKVMIIKKEIEERQILVYNGKLNTEKHQEKSIEVKISFIQQLENDYIILNLRDTTQRDLLITLEENNKYKDKLLASVSHELRAPLNGNINLIEGAINSPEIPEKIKELLLVPALRSGKFLLHLINDILDMAQIKEKKLRLVFRSEDLSETLKSTAQLVELQSKKKKIQFQLELHPNLPKNFCTDHLRLSQIVLNLLSNAIKFTNQGVVKLTATPMIHASWVKISVEDSGIGIAQENVKKLFSSYTKIDFEGREAINPNGVGLGLKITSNLAKLLAPRAYTGIQVTSVPNQGSTFSFVLEDKEKSSTAIEELKGLEKSSIDSCEVSYEMPNSPLRPTLFSKLLNSKSIKKNSNNSILNASIAEKFDQSLIFSPTSCSCSCPQVLIVDDNPFNTMAFETILSSLEVKCDSVYNGSACISSLLSRKSKICGNNCKQYAVVFMDQEMPEMNGSDTVKEIKRLQSEGLLPDMKIIGCTAHKSHEEVDKFMEAGLDQCIHKPISTVMIKDILKEILFDRSI